MFSLLIALLAQVFLVVLWIALVCGAMYLMCRALEWLGAHGVGHWLLGPFRAWTGLGETRRPKP